VCNFYPKLVIFLVLATCSVNGICQSSSARESNRAGEALLADTDKLKVGLHTGAGDLSTKVFVEFFNGSKSTLWFPIELAPAYRPNKKSHLLKIWFGYFDEVNGLHKGQYMLPAMHPVQPGEKFKFELASPSLVQNILKARMKTKIQVRVATKAFTHSRIRNSQPFEDYINNSIVFESEELVAPEQKDKDAH
jgi:hypothetical protein